MRASILNSIYAVVLLLISMSAQATPLRYDFVLTVSRAETDELCPFSLGADFGCDIKAGDQFFGSFQTSADLSSLADGIYPSIVLDSWVLQIGDVLWDMNLPDPQSNFLGFRDPALGGINPGLIVSGGAITGFFGGVYGGGDAPYLDFDFTAGPGRFDGLDDLYGTYLTGTYSIHAVSEPTSLLMFIVGLGLVLGTQRKRKGVSPGAP